MSGNLPLLESMRAVRTARSGCVLICLNPNRFGGIGAIQSRAAAWGFDFKALVNAENLCILHHKGDEGASGGTRIRLENGDFIVSTGAFFFREQKGLCALKSFYENFDTSNPNANETIGHFTILIKKREKIFYLTDQLSTCKIFHDISLRLFSTSFLVVSSLIDDLTVNPQGCYEYAWNGVAFGERTFLNQVRIVRPDHVLVIDGEVASVQGTDLSLRTAETAGFSLDDLVDFQLGGIRSVIRSYADLLGQRINLSMSGGYDSRLLLALLLEAGVRPCLFTYGKADDPEVRLVEAIAASENLPLEKIDKSEFGEPPHEQFHDIVCENMRLFDGWKVYGSIFEDGADALDRTERVANGHVKMNGSGGEIYRNFFYLPDKKYSVRQVVWSFYSRYQSSWCTTAFQEDEYEQNIADSILSAIGLSRPLLDRTEVEMVYPLFRTRYWTARDVCVNLGFGPALFPFMEPRAVAGSFDIPIKWKNHGLFEGRMIRRINPRLAAYPSSYGHSFATDPRLPTRAKYLSTYLRPPYLRKFSYRLRHIKRKEFPWYLKREYLSQVIDTSFPFMQPLFLVEKITDPDVMERIATIEFICQKLHAI
jgi:asparagine synthase (glutamine-hydrolysing)